MTCGCSKKGKEITKTPVIRRRGRPAGSRDKVKRKSRAGGLIDKSAEISIGGDLGAPAKAEVKGRGRPRTKVGPRGPSGSFNPSKAELQPKKRGRPRKIGPRKEGGAFGGKAPVRKSTNPVGRPKKVVRGRKRSKIGPCGPKGKFRVGKEELQRAAAGKRQISAKQKAALAKGRAVLAAKRASK